MLIALAQYPEIITEVLNDYERYERQEARLSDIISGYTDVEVVAQPDTIIENELAAVELEEEGTAVADSPDLGDEETEGGGGEEGDGESELDGGPDPVLAKERFTELKDLLKSF